MRLNWLSRFIMMALIILRCAFVFVAAGLGISIYNSLDFAAIVGSPDPSDVPTWLALLFPIGLPVLSLLVIGLDASIRRKQIDMVSCVYFGILVGLFMTYLVGMALAPLLENSIYRTPVQLILSVMFCYVCISMLMQTKDDFRFIVPYVEFAKEVKGLKPYVLDTSVVIDGRIADVVETGLMDNQLIMPRFMLMELQNIADSSDKLRRGRGRRGLDILNRMRNNKDIDLKIYDRELPDMAGETNDLKLVLLAKHLEGKVVTGDYNLNKIAQLHNIEVINFNDLANAVKPVLLPGEKVQVNIVKAGEEAGQGVGYLEDGTMIVIEGGREHLNQVVQISVTSVLQTSAGRMIFGKCDSPAKTS